MVLLPSPSCWASDLSLGLKPFSLSPMHFPVPIPSSSKFPMSCSILPKGCPLEDLRPRIRKIISLKFRRQMLQGGLFSPSCWLFLNIWSFRDQSVSVLKGEKTWIYFGVAIRFWRAGSFVFLLWGPGKSSFPPWPGASDKQKPRTQNKYFI